MPLPLNPPYLPMEALLVQKIPQGPNWQYEPKWDGFRCLAFKEQDTIKLQSKSGQPLARYFPDVVSCVESLKPSRFVIDGEIVVPFEGAFSFEELLQRIHPAASRIKKLAQERPAMLIVFDLLVDERGNSLVELPLEKRREKLERFSEKYLDEHGAVRLSPQTRDISVARDWFGTVGGGLDGIVAKRLDLPYKSGERSGMQKVKRMRTADCVVGGFRYGSHEKLVGSLLLGLYDNEGLLHHVGYTSSIKREEKKKLTASLESLKKPPGFTGRAPGGPSRWSTERSGQWEPLDPSLVVEVQYDYFSEGRFRHGTKLLRWRPDKAPAQCTLDQVARKAESATELI